MLHLRVNADRLCSFLDASINSQSVYICTDVSVKMRKKGNPYSDFDVRRQVERRISFAGYSSAVNARRILEHGDAAVNFYAEPLWRGMGVPEYGKEKYIVRHVGTNELYLRYLLELNTEGTGVIEPAFDSYYFFPSSEGGKIEVLQPEDIKPYLYVDDSAGAGQELLVAIQPRTTKLSNVLWIQTDGWVLYPTINI